MRAKTRPALVRLPRPKPSEDLLELLDSLARQALAGEIESFAFVATRRSGETQMAWHAPDGTLMPLLGEVDVLKFRLLTCVGASLDREDVD